MHYNEFVIALTITTYIYSCFNLFYRVSEDLSAEKVQLLQNTKKHYENQRDKIKEEVCG